jgi:TolB-like protein
MGHAHLQKARAIAEPHEVEVQSNIVDSREVEAIIRSLSNEKTDLLAIELHARNLQLVRLWSTVYELAQEATCSVLAVAMATSNTGAQIAFEGSVREESNCIRVTATMADAAGFQLLATRFDTEAGSLTIFKFEEQFASAL